jgi:hypothetical protein
MIRYRVDGPRGVPVTFTDHDDHGDYHFEVVFAEGGNLACVYEASRYKDNCNCILMYDRASGESWPRLRYDETSTDPEVRRKWVERFRRVCAENPGLAFPAGFK